MPQPRKRLLSTEVTPSYHVIARCVRRHFLCGVDPLTGKDYSARKLDIQDRLALLADVFAIDVCAYAVLSNHYHLVLHIDQQTALAWSDMEVARRWSRLFTGPALVRAFVAHQERSPTQRQVVDNPIQDYRKRRCSLSWFMQREPAHHTVPICENQSTDSTTRSGRWTSSKRALNTSRKRF